MHESQLTVAARRVSLVGLPGSGKSTAGRLIARRLGWNFADTDALIERRVVRSVRRFFADEGETRFRDIETVVLDELMHGAVGIVATGGGIVLRQRNRSLLHERSVVVYLCSTPEVLFARLRHDSKRPLLQVDDPLARLRELHAERDPLYRETAHYVIETGRPVMAALVNLVLMQLELAGVVDACAAPPAGDASQAAKRVPSTLD